MAVDFMIGGLEELQADIETVLSRYPDETKKKLQQVGREFTKDCNAQMPLSYKSGKRAILKSWRVTVDEVQRAANQVYIRNTAPHFHLVENGHRKFINGKDTGGFVPGKHYVEKTAGQYEEEFPEKIEEFLDVMLRKENL